MKTVNFELNSRETLLFVAIMAYAEANVDDINEAFARPDDSHEDSDQTWFEGDITSEEIAALAKKFGLDPEE